MKNKDEVFSKFKEFKALIENHIEKKIKTFQSDNGREFTSNEFKELCKDSGIKRELSTPYNPQQNEIKMFMLLRSAYVCYVWEVVPIPEGNSVVTSKWIYKIKHAAYGSIEKYKARFMAHGFSQKEG